MEGLDIFLKFANLCDVMKLEELCVLVTSKGYTFLLYLHQKLLCSRLMLLTIFFLHLFVYKSNF